MHAPVSTFVHRGKQYVLAYSAGNALIGSRARRQRLAVRSRRHVAAVEPGPGSTAAATRPCPPAAASVPRLPTRGRRVYERPASFVTAKMARRSRWRALLGQRLDFAAREVVTAATTCPRSRRVTPVEIRDWRHSSDAGARTDERWLNIMSLRPTGERSRRIVADSNCFGVAIAANERCSLEAMQGVPRRADRRWPGAGLVGGRWHRLAARAGAERRPLGNGFHVLSLGATNVLAVTDPTGVALVDGAPAGRAAALEPNARDAAAGRQGPHAVQHALAPRADRLERIAWGAPVRRSSRRRTRSSG